MRKLSDVNGFARVKKISPRDERLYLFLFRVLKPNLY